MAAPVTDQHQHRRRARMRLSVIVLTTVVILALTTALVASHFLTRPSAPEPAPVPRPRPAPSYGWDLAAEHELATRPMTALPPQAAQPQSLTTEQAGEPIMLPEPQHITGRWIPGGFPATTEGALAQLKALNEAAMRGGDPATYARGYRSLALAGAPPAESTGLYSLLRSMRSSAGLDPTGTVPDLTVTYEVTHGQVKGTTDRGYYVVACVLGQLSVDYRGQTITAGVGDCQALRRVGEQWRISPGPMAAAAPSAWPGSADAVNAGYRVLRS
ncbi:hypothetical protein LZ318_30695 [Saccharopolyspora indica]|uniref:hypothetical protein n=1 Tax=Saccharopolyspora indica TaxID=1229659 RepID=UPI0022EA3D68|nr:hypothetical protein [Saccharopolyspora indica]MDA3644399.1 hypothetical protein [Saccharopolyspora indica]